MPCCVALFGSKAGREGVGARKRGRDGLEVELGRNGKIARRRGWRWGSRGRVGCGSVGFWWRRRGSGSRRRGSRCFWRGFNDAEDLAGPFAIRRGDDGHLDADEALSLREGPSAEWFERCLTGYALGSGLPWPSSSRSAPARPPLARLSVHASVHSFASRATGCPASCWAWGTSVERTVSKFRMSRAGEETHFCVALADEVDRLDLELLVLALAPALHPLPLQARRASDSQAAQ